MLAAITCRADSPANDDWPMWRYDAGRSAASPNKVPETLSLLWRVGYGQRQPAWDDPLNLDLMTYDRTFEPIVLDGRVFLGFNDRDKLLALDANTGKELWSYFAEGPVRLPPVGYQGRIYFCSDDGFLYCVKAEDGQLVWKFRGAPNAQHVIGNRRIISAWPARGAPVIRDGKLYFAASIWPFMGTFIYCLDAETGRVEWRNDNTGAQYIKQPHSAPSFAGVAPQGAMVATEKMLVVPGGRSVPAVLDRATGEQRYFEINAGGKGSGGSFVAANDNFFFVHTREKGTRAFELASGLKTAFMPNEPVLTRDWVFSAEVDKEKPVLRAYGADQKVAWEIEADGRGDLILSDDKLIAASKTAITIIRLPQGDKPAEIVASIPVDVQVERLLVAGEKLFAVSLDGQVLAFGKPTDKSLANQLALKLDRVPLTISDAERKRTGDLLATGSAEGYAYWYGDSSSRSLEALVEKSPFVELAVIDADASRLQGFRWRVFEGAEVRNVSAHCAQAGEFRAPSYTANMVFIAPELAMTIDAATLRKVYESVRPFGGVMHLLTTENATAEQRQQLADRVRACDLEKGEIEVLAESVCVRRVGALPGSADWTHQYGDVANTLKSNDSRVKLPLGVLWFGGNSNMDVLPRHGHGPPEQVVGGRLYIQGMNSLNCRDVYTGRVIWKRQFENLGTFDVYYDATYEDTPLDPKYNQVHIPGANGRGTNYVVTEDRVYILVGNACLALDPKTGETLTEIQLPKDAAGEQAEWGYIGVYKDVLIGGLGFAKYRERHDLEFETDKALSVSKAGFGSKSLDRAASVGLVGFDRYTGKQLWTIEAKHSFWHNGIVAGSDKIYCLDKFPSHIEEAMRRRGKSLPGSYRIVALNYLTGQVTWEVNDGVFGTWLGYSEKHDLLLHAGAQASDRLTTETGRGMSVLRGADGSVQWKNDTLAYSGPCILHNDLIITNANAYSESAGAFYIQTGKPKLEKNPLTGEIQPWKITRAYGCNSIIASENMLTFRSGAAGFYDLLSECGTGNLGGFKSGCTANLVVANGVLNAPDYTRTCSCAYQNQTSLALVHMPDIEVWTVDSANVRATPEEQIERIAINFGAPGDRRDADGQLWMEYPTLAGDSATLKIQVNADAKYFQHHSSLITDADRPWVLASGVDNLTELDVKLRVEKPFTLKTGLPVEHVDDDAEEDAKGEVDLTSSDLELVEDSSPQTVGVRFNKLNLARGTKIRSAYLQFTCDEGSKEETALQIAVEDSPNAARFSATSRDISSRIKSKTQIPWNPAEWKAAKDATEVQRTPDLAALVQSIVDHADWQPGNSMAFLFTGKGHRIVTASKGPAPEAPRLVIDADFVDLDSLSNRPPASRYNIRLHFAASPLDQGAERVFDVYAQDELVCSNVTINPSATGAKRYSVQVLENVAIPDKLKLRFVPKQGKASLAGIEIVKQP
ncbi:MAG: PQQ-binding-like beta-propeller repeat protein [Pirellulaceae bacterium]|nr:PQQ-binding-like beta-propeller repeat protein [Pirellulaceae bacterium]